MSICWERLEEYRKEYAIAVEQERIEVLAAMKDAMPSSLSFSVIGANISRQVFFAIQFANNPNLWTVHLAPAFLRCMYELNVRIMWLVDDPDVRSKAFIKSSLKEIEAYGNKLKDIMGKEPERTDIVDSYAAMQDWLKIQEQEFPSSDGGKMADVRKMAEKLQDEALKMYRMYNSSLSPAVHSSWNFIEPVNLRHTNNPLHRFVRIPKIEFDYPALEYFQSVGYFADTALQIGRGSDISASAYKELVGKLNSADAQCKH